MKQAVMYGGGNIGRGFIGATLSQSGYEVTFIDVAEPVIQALQPAMDLSRDKNAEEMKWSPLEMGAAMQAHGA